MLAIAIASASCVCGSSFLHSKLPMRHVKPPASDHDFTTIDTLVVGGGISGTTAAFYLHKNGSSVLVAEEQDDVGGCFTTRNGKKTLSIAQTSQ